MVRISILWWAGEEFLEFDPVTLTEGSFVSTLEFWPDEGVEVKYKARCVGNTLRPDKTRIIELAYERKLNPQLDRIEYEIPWGKTTLEISARKVSVRYDADTGGSNTGAALNAQILSAALFSQRKRTIAQVMQRTGQQRLRGLLLKATKTPRCAVTGETIQAVLDAAHIIDDSKDGAAETTNGLLLRADLHRLFDARPKNGRNGGKDHMTITGMGKVVFSPSLRDHQVYQQYHNKALADRAALHRVQRNLQAAETLYGQP